MVFSENLNAEQKKFAARTEALEHKMTEAQTMIDSAPAHKQASLHKHL